MRFKMWKFKTRVPAQGPLVGNDRATPLAVHSKQVSEKKAK